MSGKILILQSYRTHDVPPWIARCLASVRAWAALKGYDYRFQGDEIFALCGDAYLAKAGGNMRTITNLARLEMVRNAHAEGYEWAVWMDADLFVFDPDRFSVTGPKRYAFCLETWIEFHEQEPGTVRVIRNVNNCVFACKAGEPDLDFLIHATRHIAMHRELYNNFQVGGDLIKGLRKSLAFEMYGNVGMFSHLVVLALARDYTPLINMQAKLHAAPTYAANLCASENYHPPVGEPEVQAAMDRLETTRGEVINRLVDVNATVMTMGQWKRFETPGLEAALGLVR